MNQKNIRIFYALAFLQGLVFYSSIATLYRTTNGITLLEMGIIESLFSIFMIVLELPWGMICDRIGYKKTMLLAISVSGLSGCDSSLLYLSVKSEQATGVYGKQSMFGVIGMVIASMSFTFILKGDIRMSALATVIPYFFAFILTLFLDDIQETQEKHTSLKSVFATLWKNKSIMIVLLASVLLTETTHTITIFYNQLQYERVGIPVAYYGLIFMGLQFVSMSCGFLGNITKHISKEKLAYLLFFGVAVAVLGLQFSEDALSTIVLLTILTCIEYMYFPILTTIENESVEVLARATMISVYSLITNLFTAFTSAGFGNAAEHSLQSAYWLAFGFCITGFLLFAVWHERRKSCQFLSNIAE